MITIGPLTLKPHPLIALLFEQVAAAKEAMEAGDYDDAYRILEIATDSPDPIDAEEASRRLPDAYKDNISARRIFSKIVEAAPTKDFFQKMDILHISVLTTMLVEAESDPKRFRDPEWLALMVMYASDCGLASEIEIETSDASKGESG